MTSRSSLSVLLLSLLLLPAGALARISDPDLRNCQRSAMNNREQRLIDTTRNYHINWHKLLQERRERFFDSWGIENDRDRQNIQRDIDKDVRNRLRENDNNFRNDQRNITNDFRNDDRSCQDQYKQRLKEVPVGLICYSSNDCRPPLGYCTTDTGECRQSCRPGNDVCIQVCSGKCRLR